MPLKKVDYDQHQHEVYAVGRAMPDADKAAVMDNLAAQLPERRPLTVIDLGCGIGRLTPALADRFGGPVFGVEPSARMLAIAEETAAHPKVSYQQGEAAAIPLPDQVADLVLMHLSYHHVPDRAAAALEIARVLKPEGRVLIYSGFSDRFDGSWWHRYFPSAFGVEQRMFPSTDEVRLAFASTGLAIASITGTQHRAWLSIADAAARLSLRPFSTFEHIDEAEIVAGLARLKADAAAETDPQPIWGYGDLMVLERAE